MKKNIQLFQSFWQCLVSVGMSHEINDKERKYIKFTNVIAVLSSIAVAMYVPFSIAKGFYGLAVLQSVDTLCILAVLWLNHLGYIKASRHLYILVINIFVLINSCLIGYDSRVQDFFYIVYIVPFLFFGVKDYRNILVGVLTSILFFNIYQSIYPYFVSYNFDANTQHLVANINLWMKFVLFGGAIYILSYYNFTTEAELAESNKKLKAQALELQRSNDDLEQFAAIISHDLKAPVRNVSSFMNLLLKRHAASLDKEMQGFIELSKNSADRMARQIDDLLSYSKVARDLPPATTVDVNSMIAMIKMELGEKIREKNAEVIVEHHLPTLREVHSSMIHHIFQNLIANGIKFNENRKPEVKISYAVQGDNYVFCVKDNGIGIDPIYQEKIFQMFKRLHSDTEFEGSGVGLAVCKKIVDFYGGMIWMESEPGRGTSFYFTIDRRAAETRMYRVESPAFASSGAVLAA